MCSNLKFYIGLVRLAVLSPKISSEVSEEIEKEIESILILEN